MISMQYNISLPSDYDMDIIKNRIRENGSKTDSFLDLKMKVYLIAEKNKYKTMRINMRLFIFGKKKMA